ncbi:MAG: response regulator [Bacteroidales bacterium]
MMRKLGCVLLVDDNDSDNFLHNRVLDKAGIAQEVKIAENGKDALDLIFKEDVTSEIGGVFDKPDLIFLDINMPVMDGWEFLREFRKRKGGTPEETVVVILTTSLNPADKVKAEELLASGCFYYKPLTKDMLDKILQLHFPSYL